MKRAEKQRTSYVASLKNFIRYKEKIMKKTYGILEIEITVLEEEDVVRTSPNYGKDETDDYGNDVW